MILAMVIWGLLTTAFITRLIRFSHSVLAEVRHPVMSRFVSLFPATTMLRGFALLMQGKLLIRTERTVLIKAEDKE